MNIIRSIALTVRDLISFGSSSLRSCFVFRFMKPRTLAMAFAGPAPNTPTAIPHLPAMDKLPEVPIIDDNEPLNDVVKKLTE